MKIKTKTLDNNDTIYSVEQDPGTRAYPIGYFKTEAEAVAAYDNALEMKQKNYKDDKQDHKKTKESS